MLPLVGEHPPLVEERTVRLLPIGAVFAFACAVLSVAPASAATLTTGHPGARAVWSDTDRTGPASASGEAKPVEIADDTTAPAAAVDAASSSAIGEGAASNDPDGKILLVWVWLLPLSGGLSIAAYIYVTRQVNRSFGEAEARKGKTAKKLGYFV